MKIEKILFPTKFREFAFEALESLLVLKDVGLREVVLHYVIPREEVGFVPYGGYLKDEEERLREETRIRFEEWQQTLSAQGIGSKIVIEVGDPVPNILALAEKEKVDLLVVGKKKKTGPELSFVGSHTLQLITRSTVPTLVSKHVVEYESSGEMVTCLNDKIFQRPLFATDWSEPSSRALELLSSLKNVVDTVYVCHVIGVKISKDLDKSGLHRLEKESRERLARYCEKLTAAGIPAEPHLGAGEASLEVIRIARETHATMIMMGTTGKDRIHEFFLGSNSHRVAQMSELPTLLVP
jgi:nucleotide-binding universal stress UspA family protein